MDGMDGIGLDLRVGGGIEHLTVLINVSIVKMVISAKLIWLHFSHNKRDYLPFGRDLNLLFGKRKIQIGFDILCLQEAKLGKTTERL